jgi:hypothetical protein
LNLLQNRAYGVVDCFPIDTSALNPSQKTITKFKFLSDYLRLPGYELIPRYLLKINYERVAILLVVHYV